jgi:hypothetical protein
MKWNSLDSIAVPVLNTKFHWQPFSRSVDEKYRCRVPFTLYLLPQKLGWSIFSSNGMTFLPSFIQKGIKKRNFLTQILAKVQGQKQNLHVGPWMWQKPPGWHTAHLRGSEQEALVKSWLAGENCGNKRKIWFTATLYTMNTTVTPLELSSVLCGKKLALDSLCYSMASFIKSDQYV